MIIMVIVVVLLDLYVLDKIDFNKDIKYWMDRMREVIMVKVGIFMYVGNYLLVIG